MPNSSLHCRTKKSGGRHRGPLDEHEEDTQVAKKGHTEEQILRALR